jgi:acyl-CoA synthetase (AMP-forming)/AMP-acid ligase II
VVVLKPGSVLDGEGVKTWVSAELARYKVPTHVIFRDALPYNATGKVLKHELEAEISAELAAG